MDIIEFSDGSKVHAKRTWTTVDYSEAFARKRKGLHDMVADGDGFTREEIYDLVLTANKAVWQNSRE